MRDLKRSTTRQEIVDELGCALFAGQSVMLFSIGDTLYLVERVGRDNYNLFNTVGKVIPGLMFARLVDALFTLTKHREWVRFYQSSEIQSEVI